MFIPPVSSPPGCHAWLHLSTKGHCSPSGALPTQLHAQSRALPPHRKGSPLLPALESCTIIPCAFLKTTFLEIIPFEISSQFEGALPPAGALTGQIGPCGHQHSHTQSFTDHTALSSQMGATFLRGSQSPPPASSSHPSLGETSWRGSAQSLIQGESSLQSVNRARLPQGTANLKSHERHIERKGSRDTCKANLKITCLCLTLLKFILPECINQETDSRDIHFANNTSYGLCVSKCAPPSLFYQDI